MQNEPNDERTTTHDEPRAAARLIQKIRAVQGVSLLRDEPRVADQAAQLFLRGAMMRAGGRHHVLLDHDAADVIAAEAQADLAGLESRRHPGGLDVQNVVEIEARDGQRLEVFDAGRLLLDEAAQRGVLALEGPRDERGESTGLFLNLADHVEVVHALFDGLAAAEHHGRGSAKPQRVRRAMHFDPVIGRRLEAADAAPHIVVQDLGPAAGNRIEAGVPQPGDGVANTQLADLGNVHDLGRGETVAPDLGKAVLDGAQQIFVPLDLQVGVQAALHEDAGAAEVERLLDLLENHFLRMEVAFGVAHRPVERAKAAVFRAEVRIVDIAVDDVADDAMRVQLAAHCIGGHADADQVVAAEQVEGFLAGHSNTGLRACSLAYSRNRSRPLRSAGPRSKVTL